MICPRCHFRLASGAHICRTCGYVLQNAKKESGNNLAGARQSADKKPLEGKFWNNVFALGHGKEKVHVEEPALGES
jgi:hypothetical protein